VVAPVTQAVQKTRIGRACNAADHRCELDEVSSRTRSREAVSEPFVLSVAGSV
jgi:hypothetical protein